MARQTRAQRRARRAEQQRTSSDGTIAQRAATSRTRPFRAPEPARAETRREPRGGGLLQFGSESWAELKKVEWPTQPQLIQGVVVVLIACLIVGVYLYGADLVFKRVVQDVFLR
jgi:preprotein translocase subunit SecE